MTTMIERVARAIEVANAQSKGLSFSELTHAMARAAIEAMREPTDAMVIAGLEREAAWVAGDCGDSDSGPLVSTQVVYEAMIDAALLEQQS